MVENSISKIPEPLLIKLSENRFAKFFWLGFIIYTLGATLASSQKFNGAACQGIQLVGIMLILYYGALLINPKLNGVYLKTLFVIYFSWLIFILQRGVSLNYDSIKLLLFDENYGIFIYLAPLIILFPKKLFFYKNSFNAIFLLGFLFLVMNLVFFKYLINSDINDIDSREIVEYLARNLSIPSGFVLMTYVYHSKTKNLLALGVLILTILLAVVRARRGLLFISSSIVIVSYIIYIINSKHKLLNIFCLIILSTSIVLISYNSQKNIGLTNALAGRMNDDTRSSVEICLQQDMKIKDWIIGKGSQGQYFCPGIDSVDSIYRTTIETGYLNIILKGGFISLGLLLSITLPAIFLGLFYSTNLLSKAASIWLLLWLIYSYPVTINVFTLNYLIFWICIGICFTKQVRKMPENTIKSFFNAINNYHKSFI